ncbi:hypothetical protein A6456_28065 [Paraburkholderia tropica]|nr:hypothetical protein A6456_28065 [Paraburkholderia tropica]
MRLFGRQFSAFFRLQVSFFGSKLAFTTARRLIIQAIECRAMASRDAKGEFFQEHPTRTFLR